MPQAVRMPRGMRATTLELMPVACSVAQSNMVPKNTIHTTTVFQSSFLSSFFIWSTTSFALNGKRS